MREGSRGHFMCGWTRDVREMGGRKIEEVSFCAAGPGSCKGSGWVKSVYVWKGG